MGSQRRKREEGGGRSVIRGHDGLRPSGHFLCSVLTGYLSPWTVRYDALSRESIAGYIYVSRSVVCLSLALCVCVTCVLCICMAVCHAQPHFIDCLCLCCSRFVSLLPLASTAVALNTHAIQIAIYQIYTYIYARVSIYLASGVCVCVLHGVCVIC